MKSFHFILIISFCLFIGVLFNKCAEDRTSDSVFNPVTLTQRSDIQNPCETGSMGNCSGPYYTYTTSVTLDPPYPGCTFDITYRARFCDGALDIIFLYYDDLEPGAQDSLLCAEFQADIDSIDAANNPISFDLWNDGFENQLAKSLATKLLIQSLGNIPSCGTSTPPINVSYISAHCSYFCLYRTNENGGKSKKSTASCADICCEQKYTVCDANGTVTFTKVSTTVGYGTCPSTSERICPPFTYYRSQCQEKCRFNF